MTSKAYDATLAAWAKAWREENLTPLEAQTIQDAMADLYDGGPTSEDYPGFVTACAWIKVALADMPRELWLDVDSGQWQDSEPKPTRCEACEGEGTVECIDSTDEDYVYTDKCDECNGCGQFDPDGEWEQVMAPDLRAAIVGRELAEYVRP
jgi:hypothetical protein